MASAERTLEEQQASLEARIRTLVNHDLKEICKAYGHQVSGTKPVLQGRCMKIVQSVVRKGEHDAFAELEYRVRHHGLPPPPDYSATKSSYQHSINGSKSSYQQSSSTNNRSTISTSRLPPTGKFFKPSPFYDIFETILGLHDLPEMPQNRNTINAKLTLTADQATRLRDDSSLRILLYCGNSLGMSATQPIEIAFPNQLEIKVNGDDVKANFKGLKNKAGSTKPADITDKIRKTVGYQNLIQVTYALTNKRFAFVAYLARYVSPDQLIERIRFGKVIPKEKVLREMEQANADPDIAATSVRMSLKDPISTVRITFPVRSTVCTHNQCFDGAMFLQLQEQAPQWNCPICSKSVAFESLCVDKYFEDILQQAPRSIEKVDIEPSGQWSFVNEDNDADMNAMSSKRQRASYDDDFDDDELIEVTENGPKPISTASYSNGRAGYSTVSPMQAPGFGFSTPSVPSRASSGAPSAQSAQRASNKRPASAVIDLTLSDDDEPPRQAIRRSTSMHQGSIPQSYHINVPTSDNYSYRHSVHADSYRPPNSSEAIPNRNYSSTAEPSEHSRGTGNSDSMSPGRSANANAYTYPNSSAGAFTLQSQPQPIMPGPGIGQGQSQTQSSSNGIRFSGFPIRQLSQSDTGQRQHSQQQQQQQPNGSLLLPVMSQQQQHQQHQQHQQKQAGLNYDGWRTMYGNFPSSPSE